MLPVLLLVVAGLSGIFDRDLWTPDEPRVAAISLEMSRSRDFVIPRLAGEAFVEEPPLYYAAAAVSAKLFGFAVGNTAAIRMTSVLWGLAALVSVFLLARCFFPARQALPAALMLATMSGFLESTHWIRVDVALLFFVSASMWCFAEALVGDRRWFAVPAGVFAAGAFLVKGVVGPGVIAFGWLALFAARAWSRRCGCTTDNPGRNTSSRGAVFSGTGALLLPHLLGALVFICLAGAWILLLRLRGGAELWHEWFWVNHVGRFLGTEPQLGHLQPGQPFYYLKTLVVYTLPWTPLVALWLFRLVRSLIVEKKITPVNLFLLAWSVVTVAVLTVPATKRDLYLLPVLPVFALMGAGVLDSPVPRWCRVWLSAWGIACTVALAVCAYSPLLAWSPLLSRHISHAVSPSTAAFLFAWTSNHAVAGACFAACLFLLLRAPVSRLLGTTAVTAAAFAGVFAVAGKAVDMEKGVGPEVRSFVERIPKPCRDGVGAWGFSETMRGYFYYYCDWPVARLKNPQRLSDILAGKDDKYDSLLISFEYGQPDLGGIPVDTLAEMSIGSRRHERKLVWMKSAGPRDVTERPPGGP